MLGPFTRKEKERLEFEEEMEEEEEEKLEGKNIEDMERMEEEILEKKKEEEGLNSLVLLNKDLPDLLKVSGVYQFYCCSSKVLFYINVMTCMNSLSHEIDFVTFLPKSIVLGLLRSKYHY
jgi:hypothetical protein